MTCCYLKTTSSIMHHLPLFWYIKVYSLILINELYSMISYFLRWILIQWNLFHESFYSKVCYKYILSFIQRQKMTFCPLIMVIFAIIRIKLRCSVWKEILGLNCKRGEYKNKKYFLLFKLNCCIYLCTKLFLWYKALL